MNKDNHNIKNPPSSREIGYTTIRISKKAYNELVRRAIAEKRTLVAQLDMTFEV